MSKPAHEPKPSEPPKGQAVSLSADEHAQLTQQAEEAAASKDRYLRALADLENSKKRMERDREEFIRFAAERLIRSLLPILDSFEQELKALDAGTPAATRTGLELMLRQLRDALQREGVKRIEAAGQPFDHHCHEAIQQVERPDVPDNTIVEEVQAGYTLHGRLIRTSLVKVAKGAPPAGAPAAPPPAQPDEQTQDV